MPLFSDIETHDTEKQFDDGCVGKVGIGGSKNGQAFTTETIRITADEPEILEKLAKKLGGDPVEWETNKSDRYEMLIDSDSVDVDCLEWDAWFERWHERKRVNHCDGQQQMNGEPCECPFGWDEKREAAKQGKACKPKMAGKLKFADNPDIGTFRFESNSWDLAKRSNVVEEHVADGPAPVTVAIHSYTNKKGQLIRMPRVTPR